MRALGTSPGSFHFTYERFDCSNLGLKGDALSAASFVRPIAFGGFFRLVSNPTSTLAEAFLAKKRAPIEEPVWFQHEVVDVAEIVTKVATIYIVDTV